MQSVIGGNLKANEGHLLYDSLGNRCFFATLRDFLTLLNVQ